MLVKTSIIMPLIDQFILRSFKYKAINTINTKKLKIPSITLTGYSIGYCDILPKETIINQQKTHTNPTAPTADIPKESAVVFMLQLFLTVLVNIKQNRAEIISMTPKRVAQNGQPFIKLKVINTAVGVSAPPIIPIAPF